MHTHNLAHTIRLYPTKAQETFFKKACGMVIDRDLNAAINLRNYSLNKIGEAIPESTPAEMEVLAYPSSIGVSETTVDEAGILECSEMST